MFSCRLKSDAAVPDPGPNVIPPANSDPEIIAAYATAMMIENMEGIFDVS